MKKINDIKELMIENNNAIVKILNIISNYNMPVVIQKILILTDTNEFTTDEDETLRTNRQIVIDSMNNFGASFNIKNGGTDK